MEGLKNIISLIWQDFIDLIHIFAKGEGSEEIKAYSNQLKKEGIIFMPNYIAFDLVDRIRKRIENLAREYPQTIDLDNGVRFDYRNQNNPNGPDSGMLDISFVDRLIPEVDDIDRQKLFQIIKNTTGQKVIFLRNNAYLNNGVKNTRTYHIDNTQPVIYKAFIYLSDVPEINFGPYSFIRRSHRFSLYKYINIFLNAFSGKYRSTDMPIYRKSRVVDGIGKKGDLILSSQNGIHRGHPQKHGKKRVALILNFMVISRLNYLHETAKRNIARSKVYAEK